MNRATVSRVLTNYSELSPTDIIFSLFIVGGLCFVGKGVMSILCFFKKKAAAKLRTVLTRTNLKQVIYVDSMHHCQLIVEKHFLNQRVLGLDCEWVTIGSHRKPVSLLQIASPEGVCALFRIGKLYQYDFCRNTKTIPNCLEFLLKSQDILKVGVAIENDAKYLAEDYRVQLSAWLDLRHLALNNGILPKGLAYLAQETVGIALDKKFNVRVSNWDADFLTEEQIQYAAMDAHAAMRVFTHCVALKESLLSLLFPMNTSTYSNYIQQHSIQSLTEVPYKDKQHYHTPQVPSTSRRNFSTFGSTRVPESTRGDAPWRGFRPGKVYDNCYLLDPQSRVLCTCDKKKARWYLDKNLGTLVKQDPFTVRLLFEPQDFDREDCKYYAGEKRNQCVVCGDEDKSVIVKKYIVPHEYRKYMPDYMKDRRSHDVLLMCYRCHKRSNILDQRLRATLADECDAPLDSKKENRPEKVDLEEFIKVKQAALDLINYGISQCSSEFEYMQYSMKRPVQENVRIIKNFYRDRLQRGDLTLSGCIDHASALDYTTVNVDTRKVKSAALALKRHKRTGQLPERRRKELEDIVNSYYKWGGRQYSEWDLDTRIQHATELCDSDNEASGLPHGQTVVEYFQSRDRLEWFETRWRQHFLSTMQPKYLPEHWSLNHNFERRRKKCRISSDDR